MRFKQDIGQVRQRMRAFWAQEMADRALISAPAPLASKARATESESREDSGRKDAQALIRQWEDPDTMRRNALHSLETTYLGGDTLPVLFQNYGTAGHCRYFGAKPTYSESTLWFDPVWTDLTEVHSAYDETLLEEQLQNARRLTDWSGGDYLMGMPDHCGTLDALGHLYGSQRLLVEMLAEPQKVQEAARLVDEKWISAHERFYQASRDLNGGGVHAWMHLWAPGRVQQMQCDMSVMISPAMYESFVLPELERQMTWIEYPVYHFDGIEQTRHLDLLLSLKKLKAIQWTHVAGQPSPARHLPTLRRIQAAGKSLLVMTPPEDVPALLDGLSAKGLYLHTKARTQEEAQRLVAYVERNSRA